jgi:hypothetical protein
MLLYNSQRSKSILLFCYGYVLNFGCSSMSFLSPKLVHASQNKHNTPKHRLLLNMNRSKKLNHAFVDTGIFGQHDPG